MSWWPGRSRRRDREAELDAELRDHIEREVASQVRAGVPEADARRAAHLAFGGLEQVKEECRDVRGTRWLEDLVQDVRHGARSLRRSPVFTVTVVLTLALGIGANAAIFRLVNAVLLRPLPVDEPGRLALFFDGSQACARRLGSPTGPPGRRFVYSYPLYQRLRARTRSFEGVAAQESCATPSTVQHGAVASAERADGRSVSANYFQVLGVSAHRGRTFLAEDESAPGANPVIVLSHGYWQRRFGGDPRIVGSPLRVNGAQYQVVGITRAGFTGAETGSRTDFWVPLTMQEQLTRLGFRLDDRNYSSLVLLGRRRPDVSLAAAEAEADLVFHQWLAEDAPNASQERTQPTRLMLDPGATGIFPQRDSFRDALMMLLAAAGFVLLIVCLNVAQLLLARAIERQPEMSIRASLGASRGRLVRQLATEGLLLAVVGTALGALAAHGLSAGLLSVAQNGRWEQPLALDVSADTRVLAFTTLLAAAAALLVVLLPAWRASGPGLQRSLRSGSTAITHGGLRRLTSGALVICQVAVSLVLLVGAGLLTGSLGRVRQVATGLDVDHVLLLELGSQVAGLSQPQARLLYDDLRRRMIALPGARGASLSLGSPMEGQGATWGLTARPTDWHGPTGIELVTAGYFQTLGMALERGRVFTPADGSSTPRVAVINQTLALQAFGGDQAAIGKRYHLDQDQGPEVEVVGVVQDARTVSLTAPARPMVYQLAEQPSGLPVNLLLGGLQVRAAGDPAALAGQIRQAVSEAHPGLPVLSIRTMRAQVERSLMKERLLATLSSGFGMAALFLVCIGLYGVMSRWATQRTREIGLRIALGATAGGVRWLVLRRGAGLALAGVAIGLPAAIAASSTLERFLFGLRPIDPPTLAAAAAVMLAVTVAAAFLPAWRASRTDPTTALRCS